MRWAVLIVRVLVSLPFILGGAAYLAGMIPQPKPEDFPTPEAADFMKVMVPTKYMTVVKVFELIGGLLLISGRYAPLGLAIIIPITVNIAIFDALIVKFSGVPGGFILLALEIFLLWGYRKSVAGVFGPASVG